MENEPIIYHETELLLINGRWCLTNNCYGTSPEEMFGKPTRSVVADATASYSMYCDDFCYDVLMFRVNGKWGILMKSEIIGMGCANYQSANENAFVYDDFLFLVGGDKWGDRRGEQGAEFYASIRGLIAVKKNGLWGILKIFKKDFVPLLYKEIVPCKYRTAKEAALAVTDLTDKEKGEIMDVVKSTEFGQKVRRKIDGWYSKEEHYTKAVDRIVRQRVEIISLLESVKKVDTKKLIAYLDKSGFFYRPSGPNRHHNFPGGLAEHSIGTYYIMEEWNRLSPEERRQSELYEKHLSRHPVDCDIFTEKMDRDDMILAAICHDLCKAEHYYFKGRRILSHRSDSEPKHAHATLSVKRLKAAGIDTPECEELLLAVLMHMHLYSTPRFAKEAQDQQKARRSMLAIAVWGADKLDASRHPAGRLHRDC